MTAQVPDGFVLSDRTGPFVDLIGPLYMREPAGGITLGLWASPKHMNARGFVHAAVLTCLLDVVMGRNAAAASEGPVSLVTASMTVDFVAAARGEGWLEGDATVVRSGRRLAFTSGIVTADGEPVATSSAVFAVSERQ